MCCHDSGRNTSECVHVDLMFGEMFQLGGCYVLILVLILSRAKTSERGEAQICVFREMLQQGGCLHDFIWVLGIDIVLCQNQ